MVTYILMTPQIQSRFHQTYLIEKRIEGVSIHRRLVEGELIWYNAKQVFKYQSHYFVRNISEHETVEGALEKVKNFWKNTSEFCLGKTKVN